MPTSEDPNAEYVDLGPYEFESHARQAFSTAWALAEGEQLNARHALMATMIVNRTESSDAFSKLGSLLSIPGLADLQPEPVSGSEGIKLATSTPLGAAYTVAEAFLSEVKVVWGRDFITVALLALDPSLRKLAAEGGTTVNALRDEWFSFVTSYADYRQPDRWADWWHRANVPLPHERAVRRTDRAYLLTWDPERGPFADTQLEDVSRRTDQEGIATSVWSVGHQGITIGDRVFLMRQYDARAGLVGSGLIVSEAFEAAHWARRNDRESYAQVLWDVLEEFPRVTLGKLQDQTGVIDLWTTHGSGLTIEQNVARRVEALWGVVPDQSLPLAWVGTDAIPVIGGKDYHPSVHDKLDVTRQAEVFATILIADDVRPPLALGLLGDWGVGKTFFMRLMQEKVASVAGKDAQTENGSHSVSRVAQIEFNAWHYVDSDLWASIAAHIFDGLAQELHIPTEKKDVEQIRKDLRRTIQSSKRERQNAAAAIETVTEERQAIINKLAIEQENRARAAADYDKLRLSRIWQAVLNVRPNDEIVGSENWPNMADLKEEAEATAVQLGITNAIDDVEEARRVHASLGELYSRGAGLTMAFASEFTGNRLWISALIVLLLLAVVLAWPLILAWIEESLRGAAEESLTGLLSPLLQLATIVGATATWAGRKLNSISSAMNYLEEILYEVREPRIDPEDPGPDEIRLGAEVERLDAVLATEQRQIEVFDRQITEAQAEIQRINAGGLVYDFLEGRVRDSLYLDRLGLISVIRQDFEQLGELLRDWRKNQLSNDNAGSSSPADQAGNEAEEAVSSNGTADERPIERIVLYIDDLDRCPPKRVVEVLQAVHLLLAFDLFVVVVAVDARWLERSLNETYNPRNALNDDSPLNGSTHRFDAHNYLEKIFQIPFSLPAMDETGYGNLVTTLMAAPQTQAEKAAAELPPEEKQEKPPPPPDEEDSKEEPPPTLDPPKDKVPPTETGEKKEVEIGPTEQEKAEERIKAMMLHEGEEEFIKGLHQFIHTPRLAKRFVNVYRLLRVRASMMDDFSSFVDRENGDYRAVLVLLAINVGFANVAQEILETLRAPGGSSFQILLSDMLQQYVNELQALFDGRGGRLSNSPPTGREKRLTELRDELEAILSGIDELTTAPRKNAPPFDDQLKAYSKWAREVGRYSFRWRTADT